MDAAASMWYAAAVPRPSTLVAAPMGSALLAAYPRRWGPDYTVLSVDY